MGRGDMQDLGVTQLFRVYTLPVQAQQITFRAGRFIDVLDLAVARFFYAVALLPAQ